MFLNIALLLLVFGAEKKKISPYSAAALLGAIKGGMVLFYTREIVAAVIVAVFYTLLASGFVYFLKRIDRREDNERPAVPTYSTTGDDGASLKWEYIPLVVLLLAILGGDVILSAL